MALVIVFGGVIVLGGIATGQLGVAGLFGALILLVGCMGGVERKESEAYVNRREYWRRRR